MMTLLLLGLQGSINFFAAYARWQRLILVNIKVNPFLLPAGLKNHTDTPGTRTDNLICWELTDDLHHFDNPFAESSFARQVANLQCDIEVCFHGDKGHAPIGVNAVLSKSKSCSLCFRLKSLY